VVIRIHNMFPQEFRYAMEKYLCCYALVCQKTKRSHYNKYGSVTDVFTKEDLISYPIDTYVCPMKGFRICKLIDRNCSCF
jgi:hypothetical protein